MMSPFAVTICLLVLGPFGVHSDISPELEARIRKAIQDISISACSDNLENYYNQTISLQDGLCVFIKSDGVKNTILNTLSCGDSDYEKLKNIICGALAVRGGLCTIAFCLLLNLAQKTLARVLQ